MKGALPYLWITTRKNALKRFFLGLASPKKLLAALLKLGILAFLLLGATRTSMYGKLPPDQASALLTSYLAIVLILSVLGGFTERGIAFTPSEVDFLFAGPFGRRALVIHHLAGLYPATWLAAILPFAFFGSRAANPFLGFVGATLCQIVGVHLRLAASILAIEVGDKTWQRLRGPLRFVSTVVVVALIGMLVSVMTSMGGFRAVVASATASPVARYILYPAIVAGDMANAPTFSAAIPAILGGLAACGLTLLGLLLLQVNFLEASISQSERVASIRARIKSGKGLSALAPGKKPTAGTRLPALRIFRGAGAVAWRNWIVARRSGRRLYFSIAMILVIFFPAFLSGKSEPMVALGATAILPFLLAGYFRFDFRGEGEQMANLKTLPVSRTRLAAAELAVPAVLAIAVQALLLVLLAALERIPASWAPLALLACVPVTCGVMAVVNLAHFLGGKGTGVAAVLQTIFLLADILLLAGIGGIFHALGFGLAAVLALVAGAQIAILIALIALLGLAFASHDVSADVG